MAPGEPHPHPYPPINDDGEDIMDDSGSYIEPPASMWPQFFAAGAAATGGLVMGTVIGWSGPALGYLVANNNTTPEVPVTDREGDWIASLMPAGALIGGPLGGFLMGRIGRKGAMFVDSVAFAMSYLFLAAAQNVWMLFAGRFFCGLASGVVTVAAPTYVSETASPGVRGMLGSSFQLMVTVGVLYVDVVGASLTSFRWLSVACLAACLLWALLLLWIPESPGHLMSKRDYDGARRSMRSLRGHDYIETELAEVQSTIERAAADHLQPSDLARPENLKPLAIALVLMVGQQFSGVNAILFYSVTIFDAAKTSMDPFVETVVVGGTQVLATGLAVLFIDRLGRRVLLAASAMMMMATLYSLGLYFWLQENEPEKAAAVTFLPLASLCVFIFAFSVGFGPIPWLMMSEIFSVRTRGVASSISSSFNWTLAFFVTQFFAPVSKAVGPAPTFWAFATVLAFVLAFCVLCVPETKGRSLEEIRQIFASADDEISIINDADAVEDTIGAEIDAELNAVRA